MRKIVPTLLLRLFLLIAVFACAVLVVEYQGAGDPAFCGAASGCAAVRRSALSRIGPVPLPVLGLTAFAIVLGLALSARDKAGTLQLAALAGAGGVLGAALIVIQAVQVKAFCKWCLAVDISAIGAALLALWLHREVTRDSDFETWLGALFRRRAQMLVWAVGAGLAGILPLIWGEYPATYPLPAQIAAIAVPDKVNIVSFTDFECPYCRKMHPTLHDIVASNEGRVTIERKMVPLPSHRGARPAAEAYVCTPGAQREAMASALYEATPITRDGILDTAARLGLDREAFGKCMEHPTTKATIDADSALFEKLDLRGLPYTFVGNRIILGHNPSAASKAARIALAGGRPTLPVAWMLYAFGAIAVALVLITPRLAPRTDAPPGAA